MRNKGNTERATGPRVTGIVARRSRTHLVLVADDDREYVEDLAPRLAAALDARVCTAKDVVETLLLTADHDPTSPDPFDLIILAMNLPQIAGRGPSVGDAGIRLLSLFDAYRLRSCPVVVHTAYPSYENCVRAGRAGAAAYVPKMQVTANIEPEGGHEALLNACQSLLAGRHVPRNPSQSAEWFNSSFDWLCEKFGGKWVAFLTEIVARKVGFEMTCDSGRDGVYVLSGQTYEDVRRAIIARPTIFESAPTIQQVPRAGCPSASCLQATGAGLQGPSERACKEASIHGPSRDARR